MPEGKTCETIAELKDAIASRPAYKSVTLTEEIKGSTKAAASDGQSASDTIEPKIVYKFDASGEKLRTDMTGEIGDTAFRYCSEGDDVVCETGGSAYSGTVEQFGLTHFAGIEACLAEKIGDIDAIVECAASVVKEQQGDIDVYALTLDPEKYMASDEILTAMKESGNPVLSTTFEFGFDKDGNLASTHGVIEYATVITDATYTLSGFDSTVVDPMPAADKTFADLEAELAEAASKQGGQLGLDDLDEVSGGYI